jgi:GNAT superfamily N-acetyltransferase
VLDIEPSQDPDALLAFLTDENFKYLPEHKDNLIYAYIFKLVKQDATLGYVWLYELAEDNNNFVTHMCVAPKHQGRVFTRHTVNKFYQMSYQLGAVALQTDEIDADLIKLYERIGWSRQDDQTVAIQLPYQWRK